MRLLVAWMVAAVVVIATRGAEDAAVGPRIAGAAREQIGVTTSYDPKYVVLKYPGGDVPMSTGVCSDVVVRALRKVGIDLQKEVHEDMGKNFSTYPQKWGLKAPDKNIDHRRVANLMRYFEGQHLAVSEGWDRPETYRPGDLVTWDLGGGVLHIGVVSDRSSGGIPLIIHNIGGGAREGDVLFKYRVIGHFRMKAVAPSERPANGGQPGRAGTDRVSAAVGAGR